MKLTPGDLNSELLQHLRRLSKRDPVTKLKALQARPQSPVCLLGSRRPLLHYLQLRVSLLVGLCPSP